MSHLGNTPVKFGWNWLNGVGGVIIERFFYFLALGAIMFIGVEQFYLFLWIK